MLAPENLNSFEWARPHLLSSHFKLFSSAPIGGTDRPAEPWENYVIECPNFFCLHFKFYFYAMWLCRCDQIFVLFFFNFCSNCDPHHFSQFTITWSILRCFPRSSRRTTPQLAPWLRGHQLHCRRVFFDLKLFFFKNQIARFLHTSTSVVSSRFLSSSEQEPEANPNPKV